MGSPAPIVTADPAVATRSVAEGVLVVLVSPDAAGLGGVLAAAPDRYGRERLLAVMVGAPDDAAVRAAAAEMAAELGGRDGPPG